MLCSTRKKNPRMLMMLENKRGGFSDKNRRKFDLAIGGVGCDCFLRLGVFFVGVFFVVVVACFGVVGVIVGRVCVIDGSGGS